MLKIVTYPNPVLRKKAEPVLKIDDDLLHFLEEIGDGSILSL